MRAGTRGEDPDVVVDPFFVVDSRAAARFPSPYFEGRIYNTIKIEHRRVDDRSRQRR